MNDKKLVLSFVFGNLGSRLKSELMSTTMLEYTKTILEKVSFDAKLFKKEFEKAVKTLMPEEVNELIAWIKSNFEGQPVLAAIGIES